MSKNKNENTLQYLQMPLPKGRKYSKMTKVAFGGINKRQTIDSGSLTMERDISTSEYPYLTPAKQKTEVFSQFQYSNPISMFGFDDFLLVVYSENNAIKMDYITYVGGKYKRYTGTLKTLTKADDETTVDFNNRVTAEGKLQRSIVQFNAYKESKDIVSGEFDKRLLIFPDKKSMFFNIKDDTKTSETNQTFELYDMDTNDIVTPPIKYAAVHQSRVFGVSDDCVFASGFNDYTNWALDTIEEYNEKNAWMSQTQSNTKAGGSFTGITNFQGHIVCFKRDYMHEIYNTKNPFRIQDIFAEGTIDNRTIQDVDGKLIFVSEDNVKIYTGSNPRIIGHNLNIPKYTYAVSGTDNRNYYLYCESSTDYVGRLFVYDTYTELWSEQSVNGRVISFAHNKNGMYMLGVDGCVYKIDTDSYSCDWCFETDLITNKTVNIKHIKKLQMLAEIADRANTNVYILYDDEEFNIDTSHLVYSSTKSGKFPIRVKPRKTANYGFKLHIEGKGYVKLYELEIFVETGGELYV